MCETVQSCVFIGACDGYELPHLATLRLLQLVLEQGEEGEGGGGREGGEGRNGIKRIGREKKKSGGGRQAERRDTLLRIDPNIKALTSPIHLHLLP